MAQLEASMSGVVLGGVVEVVGSNLARGKIFTASIGSVDSLYPSVYIYILLASMINDSLMTNDKSCCLLATEEKAYICPFICPFSNAWHILPIREQSSYPLHKVQDFVRQPEERNTISGL